MLTKSTKARVRKYAFLLCITAAPFAMVQAQAGTAGQGGAGTGGTNGVGTAGVNNAGAA